MKHFRPLAIILLLLLSMSAYAQAPTKMQAVVKKHDEVMSKMPELMQLIGQLQPKADSTTSGKPYQNAISALKSSNRSMMTWMQGFGARFTADEMMKGAALSAQKKNWLREEEDKLNALEDEVDASIEKARELVDKN